MLNAQTSKVATPTAIDNLLEVSYELIFCNTQYFISGLKIFWNMSELYS